LRLRTFTAETMAEAMQLVRQELGADAIILSTQRAGRKGGVTLTAALDGVAVEPQRGLAGEAEAAIDVLDRIGTAFDFHGLPPLIADRLLSAVADSACTDASQALAAACAARFRFAPLQLGPGAPIMLVGPPGAGKTATLAKLAARARMAEQKVMAVTCDTESAGAVEQLATYTRLLDIPAYRAKDVSALHRAVAAAPEGAAVLIDSVGINPFAASETAMLAELADAVSAEPVLVAPAGGDAAESADLAAAFAAIGVRRLIVTRTDTVRRLGGILASVETARLALSDAGVSPQIADGLVSLNAHRLAGLLLRTSGVSEEPAAATGTY